MAHAVPTSGTTAAATVPETTKIRSPSLSTSTSPPALAQLSTRPNLRPMLMNPDGVDERLKKMKEMFMRRSGGRRRDKEEEKEKEKVIGFSRFPGFPLGQIIFALLNVPIHHIMPTIKQLQ
ncbi:hypothetical protein BYT27DRAFT_7262474 [Phlegmacium glaucopus]|nr:hypothetical protein BYT27DRAFT_7262474 [Phlegmacium glaucopus]